MEPEQLIGVLAGALVGYVIGAALAGGGYRYLGGNLFEVVKEPKGCLGGCLLELALAALGAGAGFLLASALAG